MEIGIPNLMNTKFVNLRRPTLRCFTYSSSYSRAHCVSAALDTQLIPPPKITKRGFAKSGVGVKGGGSKAAADAQLKENWLASLSCPSLEPKCYKQDEDVASVGDESSCSLVIGIDPDLSGALAVLRTDASGCSAEVFDAPTVSLLVGSRIRRRLDAHSIVQLLQTFGAPLGTKAYIEQSAPFPQDGKQGWWSGGFGYGLWIGVLVASGFSVIPVSSLMWKNEYELSGSRTSKDDSRKLASSLFPSVCDQLKRKKDHGRAEALLIAAYGNGFRMKSRVTLSGVSDTGLELLNPSEPPSAHDPEASLELECLKSEGAALV